MCFTHVDAFCTHFVTRTRRGGWRNKEYGREGNGEGKDGGEGSVKEHRQRQALLGQTIPSHHRRSRRWWWWWRRRRYPSTGF